eukprot:gene16039-biopygen25035
MSRCVPFAGHFGSLVMERLERRTAGVQTGPMSVSAAEALYSRGLEGAMAIMEHQVEPETLARRDAVGEEFAFWMARLPPPFPCDLRTARPEDIVCFMQTHWVQRHAGTKIPGIDRLLASPSGVESALGHLSSLIQTLGRCGPYDELTGHGNPCRGGPVQAYRRGYDRVLWKAGYQEGAAVPISKGKTEQLVRYLDGHAGRAPKVLQRLVYFRDALMVKHVWATAYRGKEGGRLCLLDLHYKDDRQIFPNGYDPTVSLPNEVVIKLTYGTKTNKRSRKHQEPVEYFLEPSSGYCFWGHLWAYLQLSHLAGYTVNHFVFRPLASRRDRFKEDQPFSCCALIKRVQKHLKDMGAYDGETSHSFRRGTLQASAEVGGHDAAARHGRIKTPAVVDRYLDLKKHLARKAK